MADNNRPMSPEEISRLPNVPRRGDPPVELATDRILISETTPAEEASASARATGDRLTIELRRGDVTGDGISPGWELPSDRFTYGVSVGFAQATDPPSKDVRVADEHDAFVPE